MKSSLPLSSIFTLLSIMMVSGCGQKQQNLTPATQTIDQKIHALESHPEPGLPASAVQHEIQQLQQQKAAKGGNAAASMTSP